MKLAAFAIAILISIFASDPARAEASVYGSWSGSKPFPTISVHAALLPTGKVLFYPYSDDCYLWDPVTDTTEKIPRPGYNIFCTGLSALPDGRVLVTGGHVVNGQGLPYASIYDPFSNTWSRQPDMNGGRWYPSQTPLANGEQLTISGSWDSAYTINPLPQVWQTDGTWRDLTNAVRSVELYPRQFLAPNGLVFVATSISRYLDASGGGSWSSEVSRRIAVNRSYGSAVMYAPGKIIFAGGGGAVTDGPAPLDTAEVIDLNAPRPVWRATSPMNFPRRQFNLTLLPDGCVLATGGSRLAGFDNQDGPVKAAEIWNPVTEVWSEMSSWGSTNYRGYHHVAMLLPDGRVLSAGGDHHSNYEVFSPPYLFKESRPVITTYPDAIVLGYPFRVGTKANVEKVTLLRLGAVTHAFNMGQRINSLAFTRTPSVRTGAIDVTPPERPEDCPPGYYMLHIVDSNGVPSVGKIVRVDASATTSVKK